MAKYIRADVVERQVSEFMRPELPMKFKERYMRIIKVLRENEVEGFTNIVRCKDCEWFINNNCAFLRTMMKDNDFCSYGGKR